MKLNEYDVRRQVRRLLDVYPSQRPEDELVRVFMSVIGEKVAASDLMAAVSAYIESPARYMPTPGIILDLARGKMRDGGGSYGDAPQREDYGTRCPDCGAVLRELKPEEQVWMVWDEDDRQFKNVLPKAKTPRFGILHDYKLHRDRRADIVGGYRR